MGLSNLSRIVPTVESEAVQIAALLSPIGMILGKLLNLSESVL